MKEGKDAKTLAKIQVTSIFVMEDMRRNVFPKFIEILYRDAPEMGTNMAAGSQQKHLSLRFATKA